MAYRRIACALIAASLLAGCADYQGVGPKQGFGTLSGAAAGGLLGAQAGKGSGNLAMTAFGTLAGALIGSGIGSSLDKADQMYMGRAQSQAFNAPIGQRVRWENDDTGNYGTITPTRQGRDSSGSVCREFQQTVYVGGRPQQAFGQACQQRDGSWKIVS